MGSLPILSITHTTTIGTMLYVDGDNKLTRAKNVTCKKTFTSHVLAMSISQSLSLSM